MTVFTFYFCLHLKANKQLFGTNQRFNVYKAAYQSICSFHSKNCVKTLIGYILFHTNGRKKKFEKKKKTIEKNISIY